MAELLWEEKGNISALAKRLKVCTRTIYRWLKACDIDLERARSEVGQDQLVI